MATATKSQAMECCKNKVKYRFSARLMTTYGKCMHPMLYIGERFHCIAAAFTEWQSPAVNIISIVYSTYDTFHITNAMNSASAKKLKFKATTANVYHAGQGHCLARKSTIKKCETTFFRKRTESSVCAVVCWIASHLLCLPTCECVHLSPSCSGQLVKFSRLSQSQIGKLCEVKNIQHTHPEIHRTHTGHIIVD